MVAAIHGNVASHAHGLASPSLVMQSVEMCTAAMPCGCEQMAAVGIFSAYIAHYMPKNSGSTMPMSMLAAMFKRQLLRLCMLDMAGPSLIYSFVRESGCAGAANVY